MRKLMFAIALCAAALAAEAAMPKVLVMVDEKALGSVSTSEIETMAVRKLADKGIETVDQGMVQANLERIQKALSAAGASRSATTCWGWTFAAIMPAMFWGVA